MSGLDLFFQSRSQGERVIGTYLYPTRFFGEPDPSDSYTCTEVIRRISIDPFEVLVTRMGGLFVEPPEKFSDPYRGGEDAEVLDSDLKAKMLFEERTADVFNRLICELALMGVVCEPASPVHIAYGQLIEGHALVVVGSGGRELYLERTISPYLALLTGNWLTWPIHAETVLDLAASQGCTESLVSISGSLPALVSAAYYYYSRRQPPEALMDAWIVTEQIVDHVWQDYVSGLDDGGRRKRLTDTRTYPASVRTEVLHTAGVIDASLYGALHLARGHRNNLAHRARISLSAASDCLRTMKALIEFVCERPVAPPQVGTGVTW